MVDARRSFVTSVCGVSRTMCESIYNCETLPRLWHVCLDLLTHIHANVSRQRIMEHVNQRFVPGEIDSSKPRV